MDFWISFFKDLQDAGSYDKSNQMYVKSMKYCFGPLIKFDLELCRCKWNRHVIRKHKGEKIKSGKPNHMYYVPEAYGCFADWGQDVRQEHVQNASTLFSTTPTYCHPLFVELVETVFNFSQIRYWNRPFLASILA